MAISRLNWVAAILKTTNNVSREKKRLRPREVDKTALVKPESQADNPW